MQTVKVKGTPGAKKKNEQEKVIPVLVYYKKQKVDDYGGIEVVRSKVMDFLKKQLGK